MSFIDPGTSS